MKALCHLFLIALVALLIIPKSQCESSEEQNGRGIFNKRLNIKEQNNYKNILIVKKTRFGDSFNEDDKKELFKENKSSESEENQNESSSSSKDQSNESENSNEKNSNSESSEEQNSQSKEEKTYESSKNNFKNIAPRCPHPPPVPIRISKAFDNILVHRMFILSGSSFYINQVSYALTGKFYHENNQNDACFRVIANNDERRVYGFHKQRKLSCSGSVFNATCYQNTSIEKNRKTAQIVYVWANEKKDTVLITFCSQNHGGWAIYSTKRYINEKLKKKILYAVSKLGFDPESRIDIEFSKENCRPAVKEDELDGFCDKNLNLISENKKNVVMKILEKGVYTVLSSTANIYATVAFLRGDPFRDSESFNSPCFNDQWNGKEVVRTGFNGKNQSVLVCRVEDFPAMHCAPREEDDGKYLPYIYNKEMLPIWTDGKKYVLIYQCLSTRYKTWALYSTSKRPVDRDTKNFVFKKLRDYDFDITKYHISSYKNCKI